MKKTSLILITLLVLAMSATTVSAVKPVRGCVVSSNTDFLYYDGSGAGDLSVSWMEHFLGWWKGYDSAIDFQGVNGFEIDDCDLTTMSELDLYIQPGGNAYLQQKSIGADGKAIINDWINDGGAYFGVCAGWYYASADYFWQGTYYDHANLLGAYPAITEGSILEIADYESNDPYAISTLSNGFNTIYYGGPTIGYQDTSVVAGSVLATHEYRDLPAVVQYNNMLLTSVHLEAFENEGITGLSTEDRIENYKYLANLINEVAGTNYFVPAYAEPVNDTPEDNETDNETQPPVNTTEIFDGFEEGLNWNIYGGINQWELRTDEVYEGSYSLGLKKTGVDNYAYAELDVEGATTFEYVRKLVGLDAADDFTSEYFDGSWHYLEHLDSGRENGGFVSKSFSIPESATKVRFGCEAGAVSEGCFVDNVLIA